MTSPHTGDPADLVWYAAYGSNLWRPRLLAYLTGGPVPHSPVGRTQAGGRDPSAPLDDRPWELHHHRLIFARSAAGWGGGGVGFLAPAASDPDGADALGRIWLITGSQFDDIAAQENGLAPGSLQVDVGRLAPDRPLDVCDGWYGRVLHLGHGPGGHPIVTVTGADPAAGGLRPAHPAYLRVVGLGLIETWGMNPAAAAAHLGVAAGNRGAVDPLALATDLARPATG